MKKVSSLLLTLGIVLGTLHLTAFAASSFFTDEQSFASWFASSAKKMRYNNVITGYPDGSFQGNHPVSRAELAVMLDRFAKNVVGKDLKEEPSACTAVFVSGLEIRLQDQNANPVTGAKISAGKNGEFAEGPDGFYSGLGEEEGYFSVLIEKEGFGTHYETVKLERDECHVIPQIRTITLFSKQP
ncbi:MAG: S-layer homology domain-containing protein [Candidatus Altimarinota bacterium]